MKRILVFAAIIFTASSLFAGSICTQRVVRAQGFVKGSTTISLSGQLDQAFLDSLDAGSGMAIYNYLDSYLTFPTLLPKTKNGYGTKSKAQSVSVSTKNGKFSWTEKDVTPYFAFASGFEKVSSAKATIKSSGTIPTQELAKLDSQKLALFDIACDMQGLGFLASLSFSPGKKGSNYKFSLKDPNMQVKVSINSKGKATASYKLSPQVVSPAIIESEYVFTNKYDYSFDQTGEGSVEHGFIGPDKVELKVTENNDKFRYFLFNGEKITNDYLLADLEEDSEFAAVFGTYDLTVNIVGSGSVGVEYVGPDDVVVTAIDGKDIFSNFTWGDNVSEENPVYIVMTSDTTVTAKFIEAYLVIDISGGSSAASWPYRYSSDAPEAQRNACKTTELWLRYIPAGIFRMGSPESEYGRGSREVAHKVTFTKGFYIGVFELTVKQYELITGDMVSGGDASPVVDVTFDSLRGTVKGAEWPASDEVDADSFMGIIRAKTGLRFDLPTEAQWEYACRATTITAFNNGKNLDDEDLNLAEIAFYNAPTSGRINVGSRKPNLWGLYDMHGNVWEWCLDWYTDNLGTDPVVNPVGEESGDYKTLRGGSFNDGASACRSAYRAYTETYHNMDRLGFRPVVNQ